MGYENVSLIRSLSFHGKIDVSQRVYLSSKQHPIVKNSTQIKETIQLNWDRSQTFASQGCAGTHTISLSGTWMVLAAPTGRYFWVLSSHSQDGRFGYLWWNAASC